MLVLKTKNFRIIDGPTLDQLQNIQQSLRPDEVIYYNLDIDSGLTRSEYDPQQHKSITSKAKIKIISIYNAKNSPICTLYGYAWIPEQPNLGYSTPFQARYHAQKHAGILSITTTRPDQPEQT